MRFVFNREILSVVLLVSILVDLGAAVNLSFLQPNSTFTLNSSNFEHFEKSVYPHLDRSPLFLLEFCDEITETNDTEENDDQYDQTSDSVKIDLRKTFFKVHFNPAARFQYAAKLNSNPLYILFQVYRI